MDKTLLLVENMLDKLSEGIFTGASFEMEGAVGEKKGPSVLKPKVPLDPPSGYISDFRQDYMMLNSGSAIEKVKYRHLHPRNPFPEKFMEILGTVFFRREGNWGKDRYRRRERPSVLEGRERYGQEIVYRAAARRPVGGFLHPQQESKGTDHAGC